MIAKPVVAAAGRSDRELIDAVAGGDELAFRELYRRHSPRLHALTHRMLGGNNADADDALQETWVRAVEKIPTYMGQSQFATWISGIAINVSLETIRRRQPLWFPVDDDASPDPGVIERMDLDDALARLPDIQRVVVVLHDVEGFKHEEIAAKLGVAEGTSRSHLSRARAALRAMLESYERIPE